MAKTKMPHLGHAKHLCYLVNVEYHKSNLRDYKAELARIETIYNGAWSKNWGAVPMSHHEFEHLASDIKPLV